MDRAEQYADIRVFHGKQVSEAYTTMACECGQLNRHLGGSKTFVCVDPQCPRHSCGGSKRVAFDRDSKSARETYALNGSYYHEACDPVQ